MDTILENVYTYNIMSNTLFFKDKQGIVVEVATCGELHGVFHYTSKYGLEFIQVGYGFHAWNTTYLRKLAIARRPLPSNWGKW